MWRVENWDEGYRGRRNQWIRQQVVVKVLAVTTKASFEVIDTSFVNSQESNVVRISAITEARCRKMIEKCCLGLILSIHREGVIQDTWTRLDVDQCGVHCVAA